MSDDVKHNGASDPKIEAIKNIIFGENIEAYNKEFEAVKAEMEAQKEELVAYVKETKLQLENMVDSLNSDFSTALEKFKNDMESSLNKQDDKKTDRKALGKMLQQIGEKLQADK